MGVTIDGWVSQHVIIWSGVSYALLSFFNCSCPWPPLLLHLAWDVPVRSWPRGAAALSGMVLALVHIADLSSHFCTSRYISLACNILGIMVCVQVLF